MNSNQLQVTPGISRRDDFRVVASRSALLIIDVQDHLSSSEHAQVDESNSYLFNTALPAAIPNINQLATRMRSIRDSSDKGCEVLITYLQSQTPDCRDISLDYKLSGPKLSKLPTLRNPATFSSLPIGLQPNISSGKGDILLPKTSCSVFQSTNIQYTLSNLDVKQLIICGQLTDQCVMSAVRDAADLGLLVTVVDDACAAMSKEEHERGLEGMKGFSRIVSTQQVLNELNDSIDATNEFCAVEVEHPSDTILSHDNVANLMQYESQQVIQVQSASDWKQSVDVENNALIRSVFRMLQNAQVKFLRFANVDVVNNIRAKAIPIKRLMNQNVLNSLDHQVSIAKVCVAGLPSYADAMVNETRIDAADVLMIKPDFNSLRILPYTQSSAMVLGYMHDQRTNKLSPLCTRGLLSRVLETAKRRGFGFTVGVELEFVLAKGVNNLGDVQPLDSSLFASLTTLNDQDTFINEVYEHLERQNIDVEMIHSESASGQIEVVLAFKHDVMELADNIVLSKETIKAIAKSHNLVALFSPKVFSNQAGNGMHIHMSLREEGNESKRLHNIFPGHAPHSVSDVGQSFMEGILTHLGALMSFTMPTEISFSRVGEGCWTGSKIGWDVEDKESPIRLCLDSASQQATNVEFKLIDSTCNPYLALASILWSGLNGIEKKSTLRPSMKRGDRAAPPLPSSLGESIERLRKDQLLMDLLGDELFLAYTALKKAEIEYWEKVDNLEKYSLQKDAFS